MLNEIKTKKQYEAALERVYNLIQKEIKLYSKEYAELERISSLVEKYEDKYIRII